MDRTVYIADFRTSGQSNMSVQAQPSVYRPIFAGVNSCTHVIGVKNRH